MITGKDMGKNVANYRYYYGGTEERYGKYRSINQESQFPGRYLNHGSPKHKAGMLITILHVQQEHDEDGSLDEVHTPTRKADFYSSI
jgi:hypothetical protein